jgi:hypothetical protein
LRATPLSGQSALIRNRFRAATIYTREVDVGAIVQ